MGFADAAAGDAIPRALGRYRVERLLGRGAMGVVYEARDTRVGRVVAIKVLSDRLASDAEALSRFMREARLLAGLHHPGIATIHGVGRTTAGAHYLVLERVDGTSLAERLRQGPLGLAQALDVGRQMAQALEVAHEYGVVHRDLKPGNVMLTPQGLVKLLDFGLAHHSTEPVSSPAPGSVESSQDDLSMAAGTLGYVGPEVLTGEPADARSDIFAFGCVLFECLSGARAFPGATARELLDATLGREPDWNALPQKTPSEVRDFLRRCLDKAPDRRPTWEEGSESLLADSEPVTGPAEAAAPRSLPRVPGRFIGRAQEVGECLDLLRRSRFLTLAGIGGCGKTRLAIEVAEQSTAAHPDGVWFVDLAAVGSSDRVVPAVAQVLGVKEEMGRSLVEGLVEHIAKLRLLLVLDNCEHVLMAVRELTEELLVRSPALSILATSREWLGVTGELVYRVPSLSLPPADSRATPTVAIESEAVRMFVDRASGTRAAFALEDANCAEVVRICRWLDGLPLAIELAAARVASEPLDEIERQLESRVLALTADGPPEESHQRTMRAAIEWSYDRLGADEQRTLQALSVFVGGCTLDGATDVSGDGHDAFDVLDVLTSLVDRSLIGPGRAVRAEFRYRLPEPVRRFALARLESSGEAEERRERHLDHYLVMAETAAPHLQGAQQARWVSRLEAEHENLLAALDHCEHAPGGPVKALRLAASVWRFWFVRGYNDVGRRALARALGRPGAGAPSVERARALAGAAGLAVFRSDQKAAEALSRECLALCEQLGDRPGLARAWLHLGLSALVAGDYEAVLSRYTEALALYRELDDTRGVATTLNNLGVVARDRGAYAEARAYYEEALPLARQGQEQDTLALVLINLAFISLRTADPAAASRWLEEGLAIMGRAGARRISASGLEVAGEFFHSRGDARAAVVAYAAAAAVREAMRLPADPLWGASHDAVLDRVRSDLDPSKFRAAWGEGRALSLSSAIRFALDRMKP